MAARIITPPRVLGAIAFTTLLLLALLSFSRSSSHTLPPPRFTKRVVAVADLHGDLPHARQVLIKVGLIDGYDAWIGQDAILVQTGDIVDRGTDTIALYRLFDRLRAESRAAGGAVHSLLGNHEIMNALNDWRYVTPEDVLTFGGFQQRRDALREGWIGQTWRANYSITTRIPLAGGFQLLPSVYSYPPRTESPQLVLDSALPAGLGSPFSAAAVSFVHGGITPSYIRSLNSEDPTARINEIGSNLLSSLLRHPPSSGLPRDSPVETRSFWSEIGPLWDRTYAMNEDEVAVCQRAKEACELLNVSYLVMGHTPDFEGIRTRCGGRVLLIDTGISRAYGGRQSALEFLFSLELASSGSSAQRWIQTEVVSALYVDQKGKEELVRNQKFVKF